MVLFRKPLKLYSHRGLRWDGEKIMASPHHDEHYIRFMELYMWSCFIKQFDKVAPVPPMQLFMVLKTEKMVSVRKSSHVNRTKIRTRKLEPAWKSIYVYTIESCILLVATSWVPWPSTASTTHLLVVGLSEVMVQLGFLASSK